MESNCLKYLTERKQAEEALRQSEEKYRTILENMQEGYFEVDLAGDLTFFNDSLCRIWGYPKDELIGMNNRQYTDKENAKKLFQTFNEVYRTEEPAKAFDWQIIRKDGTKILIEASISLQKDSSGNPIGFSGTVRDVTERRRIDEALRQSEERYRMVLENIQDGYFEVDLAGSFTFFNDSMCRLLGYPQEEMMGLNNRKWTDKENAKRLFQGFNQVYKTGIPSKEFNWQFIRKDGSVRFIEASVDLLKNSSGNTIGFQGLARDITERKLAEVEIKKAKEAAEAAAVSQSEFLANMSHEIRTPMNGIIGMIELLLDSQLSADQRQYAEIVQTSSLSLLSLLNDILDLSKIEARKLNLEKLDFNLRVALEDVADLVALSAQEKGLELTALIEPEVPSLLRGDPGRLRQAVINMAGNAVKFTKKGEVAIRVSRQAENEQTVTLHFAISDTGIGIPQNRIEALFAPFVQVDSSTTRKYGGSGLGLSISRQLVELMDGKVGCESEIGKGSTFWFTAVFEKQPPNAVMAVERFADISSLKVLVVDDHPTNRLLAVTLLKGWKCRSGEAEDGQSALANLRAALQEKDPYQVALLDMMMPEMDGEELGRLIKEDKELSDTRIIMMTSIGKRGDVSRLASLGFAGYFTKPIRQAHLYDAIALAMGRKEGESAGASKHIITRHTIAESHWAGKRILVAEDNPTGQTVAFSLLEYLGFRADIVANGAEAIHALRNIPYDLVLMDCEMPEMNGYEATRRIRKPETDVLNPAIPIIALSGHAQSDDRDKTLTAGMDDYLAKPVQLKTLSEMLSRWLTKTNGKGKNPERAGGLFELKVPEEDLIFFSEQEMMERLMDDDDLARIIIAGFLEDVPRQIDILKVCLEQGDIAGARRQAHSIKGAAANAGAQSLIKAVMAIQRALEKKDLHEAAVMLPRLGEQLELFKTDVGKSPWLKWTAKKGEI